MSAVGKDQDGNDELGMIRVLAFNAIKAFKATGNFYQA